MWINIFILFLVKYLDGPFLSRILVILWGHSATFWDITRFINQSLVSPLEAQANYTCYNDFSLKFS